MALAIETNGLTKSFSPPTGWSLRRRGMPATAVQDVSLAIEQGMVFGLLGVNGAGKTTLSKLLCTLIMPTAGDAKIAGIPLSNGRLIRQKIGLVVTDERSFYWRLDGRRNLTFFAALHGLFGAEAKERVEVVLSAVGLSDVAGKRFSNYSAGMRQRLAIARALLHRPEILFLDEPSRSLDPIATNQLHQLIRGLIGQRGMTVFLITHDLTEAAGLCDQIGILHDGRMQIAGNVTDLCRHSSLEALFDRVTQHP